MKLGQMLVIARECKGWTLRELERETGISNALLSQIETGKVKDTSFKNVVLLSRALGLSIDRFAQCYPDLRKLVQRGKP